jgi:hypothetical protein
MKYLGITALLFATCSLMSDVDTRVNKMLNPYYETAKAQTKVAMRTLSQQECTQALEFLKSLVTEGKDPQNPTIAGILEKIIHQFIEAVLLECKKGMSAEIDETIKEQLVQNAVMFYVPLILYRLFYEEGVRRSIPIISTMQTPNDVEYAMLLELKRATEGAQQ